jgi:hypothetical protein
MFRLRVPWSGCLPAPAADGSDGPLATLARAAATVQEARARQPDRRVRVLVHGGVYLQYN